MAPILSICIPTFKREKALDRTLAILAREIDPVRNEVEICVSDNCSPDDTQKVIERWAKVLPIVSARNDDNLGVDINIARATKLASGKYAWLIGDDDEMVEGSVKQLVGCIKANMDKDIGAIFLNQRMYNNPIARFGFQDFRVFKKEDLKFPLNIGAINSICLNTALAKKVIANTGEGDSKLLKKGFNEPILHGFAHSYLFLECMKQGAYVGVEPVYGMQFTASGEKTTNIKKIYLELLVARYCLEIEKYYPWFNNWKIYSPSEYWKKMFSNGAIACERPELEHAYKTLYRMYLRILANQHRTPEVWASKAFEFFRRTPLGKIFLIPLHHHIRKMQGLELDPKPNTVKDIDKNLVFMVDSVEKMLADD